MLDEDGELINDGDGLMEWTPIGVSLSFQGIFDGNGHVVKGIYIKTDNHFTGLFGRITENSEIKNIGVVDSYIEGSYFVGGICGYASESTIYNCYNATNVTGNITDA